MKKILRCRVTLFLVFGWVSLSVVGYLGKDSRYKNYTVDGRYTPYFVLVMQGIHDGIFPWSSEPVDFWEKWGWRQKEPGGFFGTEAGTENPDVSDTQSAGNGDVKPGTEEKAPESGAAGENPGTEGSGGAADGENAQQEPDGAADGENAQQEPGDGTEAMPGTEDGPKEQKGFIEVDESYFDDAVFIGDSRTVGLHDYSGLDQAAFFATVGLNVYDMWTETFCEVEGKKVTLEEALSLKQYKKVYFQIGINEMGRGTVDSFMEAYSQSVLKFMELQPDAIIYVQGIMRVAKAKSDTDPIFNNGGINERNARIAALADNRRIFYIDVNEVVCDEEGNLREELTFDNLHLLGSKYNIWVDFLKTRGVAF